MNVMNPATGKYFSLDSLIGRRRNQGMKKCHRFVAAVALLVVCHGPADAVVWSNELTDTDMLNFGQTPRFAGVGRVVGGATGSYLGTNALGQTWGITAKHVTPSSAANPAFELYQVGTYPIVDVVDLPGVDISLFRFTGWDQNLPNLGLNATGNYTPGTRLYSAGFGVIAAEQDVPNYYASGDLRVRAFETRLDSYRPADPTLWFELQPFLIDRFDAPGDPNHLPLEGFGAPGDSGSFLLDDNNQIWGILTNGEVERYGALNWYATITPELADSIYAITAIPEPASILVVVAASTIVARRRAR
jgi:hypothetical protein